MPQLTTQSDINCEECGGEIKEINTLLQPTPIIMIHINKATTDGNKTDTEVEIDDVIKIPTADNSTGETYKLSDVISHYGTNVSNGHYITTHYKEDTQTWEQINDENCFQITNKQAANINKHGILYVLRRSDVTRSNNIQTCPKEETTQTTEINKERTSQSNTRSMIDESFTLVDRRKRHRQKNPWEMVPIRNPWRMTSLSTSTKRYYVDRDDPIENSRKKCWWHQMGKCKYGEICWYSMIIRA